jgi:hypothetical protein
MEGAGAHTQLRHGGAQQALASVVQRAVLAHLGRAHVGIAQQRHVPVCAPDPAGEALLLYLSCSLHAGADVGAWLALWVLTQVPRARGRRTSANLHQDLEQGCLRCWQDSQPITTEHRTG